MKNFRNLLHRTLAALPFFLAGACMTACYDSGFGTPGQTENAEPVSETIANIKSRYLGVPFAITSDISVRGTVTSSDAAENFYRTICIEENNAALEIMAGIDRLHNDFPVGCRVTLRLQGLTLAESRGVLQVGNPPAPGSGYDTDYIGSKAALDNVLSRDSETICPIDPARLLIPELSPERCGTLVRIDRLRYLPEEITAAAWAGYKQFSDEAGNTIYTYVRTYAAFAGKEVPTETVALVGILQYDEAGEGRYILKLRDENDCIR